MIDPKISDFLDSNRVCVFSILQSDGSLHSATCLYAHTENQLEIFILTKNITKKVQPILGGTTVPASLVIGFSETEWISFQASGNARVALKTETQLSEIYEKKYNKTVDLDSDSVFIVFTPTWYRYTEFQSNPKVIIESQ